MSELKKRCSIWHVSLSYRKVINIILDSVSQPLYPIQANVMASHPQASEVRTWLKKSKHTQQREMKHQTRHRDRPRSPTTTSTWAAASKVPAGSPWARKCTNWAYWHNQTIIRKCSLYILVLHWTHNCIMKNEVETHENSVCRFVAEICCRLVQIVSLLYEYISYISTGIACTMQ